ncbi:cytoskeletal protein binding protein [Moniliophthora roreri]|nr:cytoskeletal protein binding protein [Moniliophthora roreri]
MILSCSYVTRFVAHFLLLRAASSFNLGTVTQDLHKDFPKVSFWILIQTRGIQFTVYTGLAIKFQCKEHWAFSFCSVVSIYDLILPHLFLAMESVTHCATTTCTCIDHLDPRISRPLALLASRHSLRWVWVRHRPENSAPNVAVHIHYLSQPSLP